MFQPEVKLEFVRRYCPPTEGWEVFVDIDASEEGRTGSERKTKDARERQRQMKDAGTRIRQQLNALGAIVGGNRVKWFRERGLPRVMGDRDIIAFHQQRRVCVIAEVEGTSTGQPEQKLYKAIGQLVMAASLTASADWDRKLVLVVHGKEIADHLQRATALAMLHISALSLVKNREHDRWLFGSQDSLFLRTTK